MSRIASALNFSSVSTSLSARTTELSLDNGRTRFSSSEIEIEQSVTRISARSAQRRPQRDSEIEGLSESLQEDYWAILELMYLNDPENAAEFAERFRRSLTALHSQDSAADSGQGNLNRGRFIEAERIHIAVEATVSEIQTATANGETITAEFVQLRFTANIERVRAQSDPLVLDLNGNGVFDVTTAEGGHDFDIRGEGKVHRTATATNGDALLAIDRNGNGQIDDGTELFGDQNGAVDGYSELAKYDQNLDGAIDRFDPIFLQLVAFEDKNRNGETDAGELQSLADLGIERLMLDASAIREESNGNHAILASEYVRADGTRGRIGELLFSYLV